MVAGVLRTHEYSNQTTNAQPPVTRTFVISSLIFTVGLPATEESLITMFKALLFSVPPLDLVLKSLVSEVPIPNAPTIRRCERSIIRFRSSRHTFETNLVALRLQLDCLLHIECIREDEDFLRVVHAELLVYLLCPWRKDKRVTRVLSEARPLLSMMRIGNEVLEQAGISQ